MESSWPKQFKPKQLKKMLRSLQVSEERGCVERSELEELVLKHVKTLERANKILDEKSSGNQKDAEQPSTKASSSPGDTFAQLKRIMGEDRGVLNYDKYTPSPEHLKRMKEFAKLVPAMFDDPSVTPRKKWFSHPGYRKGPQMTDFHVHFRQELQDGLRHLYQVYASKTATSQALEAKQALRSVERCFSSLNYHVQIEEQYAFPLWQEKNPKLDLSFLYRDHKHLKEVEHKALAQMKLLAKKTASSQSVVPGDDVLPALQALIELDEVLMTHLGEEEEVVIPISLVGGPLGF